MHPVDVGLVPFIHVRAVLGEDKEAGLANLLVREAGPTAKLILPVMLQVEKIGALPIAVEAQ